MNLYTNKMEQVVLGAIMLFPEGAIQDDIEPIIRAQYPESNVTARFPSLKRKGLVVETGEKRKGKLGYAQKVMKAVVTSKQQ